MSSCSKREKTPQWCRQRHRLTVRLHWGDRNDDVRKVQAATEQLYFHPSPGCFPEAPFLVTHIRHQNTDAAEWSRPRGPCLERAPGASQLRAALPAADWNSPGGDTWLNAGRKPLELLPEIRGFSPKGLNARIPCCQFHCTSPTDMVGASSFAENFPFKPDEEQ